MQQRATKRPKTEMAFGYPGEMPRARSKSDQKRLLAFFTEYLKDGNAMGSARRAGYSVKWGKETAFRYVAKYADYIKWMQAHYAAQAAKQIAVSQDDVLQEISRIAMLNEYDYLVFETTKAGATTVRRKRLEELTREQMVPIRVTSNGHGKLSYTMRDKESKLTELAKHLGMLNEKIILERRHLHLHAKLDFSKIPIEELEAIEAEFELVFHKAGATKLLTAK